MNTQREQNVILCVDDEPTILISLVQELRKELGHEFLYETAQDSAEGLEIVDELVSEGLNVILILSDWLMPGLKGDEFLAIVHKKYPNIRSILITGHAEANVAEKLKQTGTFAILSKPWDPDELLSAVKSCCSKN
ncbi:two-component system response regulator [Leptospira perolatii]|uniref:Two-component system response regulator n=1 Tax=Leptospira perolatii TaxID=2023191 RepID=A0A2M9ZIW7_9LEPT|nr:response regulator [Leptospira perolatii]PJZ68615.1 two-component system response regulator [Leptospira perolatii]PJZ71962.1 two-component system response regulator [Leptospira perolatii]